MRLSGRLELTWTGKDEPYNIERRLLIEDEKKSHGDSNNQNMLIHGDNLLALKALERKYAGKIKCIYIDPPYNTGAAFEYYDDNLEHSIWINLMEKRLVLLQKLLKDDGIIFVQIDDNEYAYLKVLMDQIFGRNNYLNTVTVKMKNIAGASGGGEDKRLKKNIEFILIYTKNYEKYQWVNNAYNYTELYSLVESYRTNNISWKYTSVLYSPGEKEYIGSALDGDGNEIKIFKRNNPIFKSVGQISKEENISEREVYYKYINSIYTTAMPQSSIRPRVMEKVNELGIKNELFSIEYTPKTGKNRGQLYEQFYKGEKFRLFAWLRDVVEEKKGVYYKKDLQGTFWDGINLNNLTKEGSVEFPKGKKPEELIMRIIDMATKPGDIVLDSFLGSGTTAAVAHKMKRSWIGIEMGDHAYTHCKVRIDRVIDGLDNGGITEEVDWNGGGGYHFYELSEPLFVNHPILGIYQINNEFDDVMFKKAICNIEGYTYHEHGLIHGFSSEKHYIHITKEYVNGEYINNFINKLSSDESISIYVLKYQPDLRLPDNVEIIDIMKNVLPKCIMVKGKEE